MGFLQEGSPWAGIRVRHIHGAQSSLWIFLEMFSSVIGDSQMDVGLRTPKAVLCSGSGEISQFRNSKLHHTGLWKSKGRGSRVQGGFPLFRGKERARQGELPRVPAGHQSYQM